MDIHAFRKSLDLDAPPPGLTPALTALWHAGKQDWQRAHEIVQAEDGEDAAWVHAHLHRLEGDVANADYWYRRAGRTRPQGGTSEEMWDIACGLLRARRQAGGQ